MGDQGLALPSVLTVGEIAWTVWVMRGFTRVTPVTAGGMMTIDYSAGCALVVAPTCATTATMPTVFTAGVSVVNSKCKVLC